MNGRAQKEIEKRKTVIERMRRRDREIDRENETDLNNL